MDKEVEKLEEDKDVATAALITEVSDSAKVGPAPMSKQMFVSQYSVQQLGPVGFRVKTKGP